jgi:hypothetical protein
MRMSLWSSMKHILPQGIQDLLSELNRLSLAVREGKALDQIRERIVGSCGVRDIVIDEERAHAHARTSPGPTIRILVAAPVTPDVGFRIRQVVAQVNRRHGTNIRVMVPQEHVDRRPQ